MPARLLAYLGELGIPTTTIEHAPVFTVEEAKRLRPVAGTACKSLLLRDHKGGMWLVVVEHERRVELKRLAAALGVRGLSLASEERLERRLGVPAGAVSPLAAVNDAGGEVTVVVQAGLLDRDALHVHPLDNSLTTAISGTGLLRFLAAIDHDPVVVSADDL
jgi:Ala-tRNA(Pro) deacylase